MALNDSQQQAALELAKQLVQVLGASQEQPPHLAEVLAFIRVGHGSNEPDGQDVVNSFEQQFGRYGYVVGVKQVLGNAKGSPFAYTVYLSVIQPVLPSV